MVFHSHVNIDQRVPYQLVQDFATIHSILIYRYTKNHGPFDGGAWWVHGMGHHNPFCIGIFGSGKGEGIVPKIVGGIRNDTIQSWLPSLTVGFVLHLCRRFRAKLLLFFTKFFWWVDIRWMGQRNPAPVENGGVDPDVYPTIYRVSTYFNHSNHPFGAGFRWPIHSIRVGLVNWNHWRLPRIGQKKPGHHRSSHSHRWIYFWCPPHPGFFFFFINPMN